MLMSDTPATIRQTTMKAIVHERYGRPDVLELREVPVPVPADDQVLVRVHASSVNPVEWYGVTGPVFARAGNGLRHPTFTGVGADVAGTVEAVGNEVDGLAPGDEVYGVAAGAWAEFASARPERLGPMPANLSFAEAGAVPIAAVTALQALRDKGRVERGQKVLINGASGGVGTFAVQLAKSFGAEVAAVCSTGNVELVGVARRRPGGRLHAGGLHAHPRAVRRDARHRRQPIILRAPARPDARGDGRPRRRTHEVPRPRADCPTSSGRSSRRAEPDGDVLRREGHDRRPRGPARASSRPGR